MSVAYRLLIASKIFCYSSECITQPSSCASGFQLGAQLMLGNYIPGDLPDDKIGSILLLGSPDASKSQLNIHIIGIIHSIILDCSISKLCAVTVFLVHCNGILQAFNIQEFPPQSQWVDNSLACFINDYQEHSSSTYQQMVYLCLPGFKVCTICQNNRNQLFAVAYVENLRAKNISEIWPNIDSKSMQQILCCMNYFRLI